MLDRIKAAVFNVLGPEFTYQRVLDLFAGSGSFGFEAASRGAREVVFVERDRTCVDYLRRNTRELDFDAVCSTVVSDAALFLKSYEDRRDLIFVDPPFEWAATDRFAEVVALSWSRTADCGLLVVRAPSDCKTFFLPPEARPDVRRYGRSAVALIRKGASVIES